MNACKVLELATNKDILKIIELAREEIQEIATKEKHGTSELKRFKLIVKYLKDAGKYNTRLEKTWIEENFQCFSNGYTAFLLKNRFENLPIGEEKAINLHECIKDIENNLQYAEFNIADVKAQLKVFKAENKKSKKCCTYDIGESRYNAKYLIDCYTILEGKDTKFYQPKNGELIPSIFESENGKAIILPIRKSEEQQ